MTFTRFQTSAASIRTEQKLQKEKNSENHSKTFYLENTKQRVCFKDENSKSKRYISIHISNFLLLLNETLVFSLQYLLRLQYLFKKPLF